MYIETNVTSCQLSQLMFCNWHSAAGFSADIFNWLLRYLCCRVLSPVFNCQLGSWVFHSLVSCQWWVLSHVLQLGSWVCQLASWVCHLRTFDGQLVLDWIKVISQCHLSQLSPVLFFLLSFFSPWPCPLLVVLARRHLLLLCSASAICRCLPGKSSTLSLLSLWAPVWCSSFTMEEVVAEASGYISHKEERLGFSASPVSCLNFCLPQLLSSFV